MTTFDVHTTQSAPEAARPVLEQAEKSFGFLPNLLGTLAEAPGLLKGYLSVGELFDKETTFNATERQIVLLAASYENGCDYCMAGHSVIAGMQGVPEDVVQALREGTPIADPKLQALRRFATHVVELRGRLAQEDLDAFFAAGYDKRQVFEVILGVAMKTISNYTNHIANTPLDAAFQPQAWTRPEAIGVGG